MSLVPLPQREPIVRSWCELPLFLYSPITGTNKDADATADDWQCNPNFRTFSIADFFVIPVCMKPFSSSHCRLQIKEEWKQQHQFLLVLFVTPGVLSQQQAFEP